jgi:AraC family transcriptional regulator, transcriptional activator of pobA
MNKVTAFPHADRGAVPTYGLYGEAAETPIDLWVHCESIPARSALFDWQIELHRHESFFQILHMGGGAGELRLSSGSREIGPGTILTLPPRVVHGFRFSETVAGSVITVRGERIASLLATAPGIRAFFAVPRVIDLAQESAAGKRMAERIEAIAEECAASREGQSALLEANLTILLVEMARLMAGAGVADHALGNRHARQFQALVDRHFRNERTVAFYAEELGISETHLNRIARAAFEQSALGVIAQRVTREAARDLIFTRFAVKEIAYSLGFEDPAYFTRFFTKHMGVSPARFRAVQTRATAD